MKEPVIANALDEAAKREILNNVSDTMTKEDLLARYVDSFIKQNGIENYETREISLRKAIASVVLGIVLFLEICLFMLYHPLLSELSVKLLFMILILVEALICLFFLQAQSMRAYLIREVIRRPDDSIDNILISQVSGSRSGFANLVRVLLPLNLGLRDYYFGSDSEQTRDVVDFDVLEYRDQQVSSGEGETYVTAGVRLRLVSAEGEQIRSEIRQKRIRMKKGHSAGLHMRPGLNISTCPYCGASVDLTSRLCTYCGPAFLFERPLNMEQVYE